MITLRRNATRRQIQRGKQHIWLTFGPQERSNLPVDNFGALSALNEIRIPPGGRSASHPGADSEVVTYVHRGALAQQDSNGSSGVVQMGEFQYMILPRGIRYKEANASRSDLAHVLRISLRPSTVGLDYTREQKRFAVAQRTNVLCVVASPDGRKKSLRLLQDAVIYSSILDPGHHLIHELLSGRSAWLHVIYGEAILHDITLTRGDGVGLTNEPAVSLTAQEKTEILLVDLVAAPSFASGVVR